MIKLRMNEIVANIVVNIILLIIYIYFFGQYSFSKYLEHGIIVINYEEKSTNKTSPPGRCSVHCKSTNQIIYLEILLLSRGLESKINAFKTHDSTFCKNTSGEDFIQCIEEGAFLPKDIILEEDKVSATPIYLSDKVGLLSQFLHIDPGAITKNFMTSFVLKLNPRFIYEMSIVGQNLQFLFASPTIPRSYLKPPPIDGIFAFYIKVKHNVITNSLYIR